MEQALTVEKQEAALAVLKPHELVQHTEDRIMALINDGSIIMPPNYSAGNALKSAWLKLQETETKDHKPVLEACTKVSIANAMLDMAIQGLNPSKDQCYFIAYGKKLAMMRSRFGNQGLAKRFGAKEVYSSVIYAGDEVIFRTEKGRKIIDKHIQKFTNVNDANITGAYCTIEFTDGRPDYSEIMNIDQIHKSWNQSKLDWEKADSTHAKFPVEMCRRTVENKACKFVIKTSNDSNLFRESFDRSDDELALAQHDENVESANSEKLEIPETIVETETSAEVQEFEKAMAPEEAKVGEVVTEAEVVSEAEVMEKPEEPPPPVAPWFGICPLHECDLEKDTRGWSKTGFYCPCKMPGMQNGQLSMEKEVGCRAHGLQADGELMSIDKIRKYRDFIGRGTPEDERLAEALGYTDGKEPFEPEKPQTQAEIIEEHEAEDAEENTADTPPF